MRGRNTLTNLEVERARPKQGRRSTFFCDGGGLNLQVTGIGGKSWVFRYQLNGRAREMGLGPFPEVSLARARDKAVECRRLLKDERLDPIDHRRSVDRLRTLAASRRMTFRRAAEAYITSHNAAWSSPKHADQWKNTLEAYVFPIIGDVAVSEIDVEAIVEVLHPIWSTKQETARRVRGRIAAVLSFAAARNLREGPNPARMEDNLSFLLPKQRKRVRHHTAMAYAAVPRFMQRLEKVNGRSARALRFTILTAARTSEVLGAPWSEFDLDDCTWSIDAERMKARREHRVPLAAAAAEILAELLVDFPAADGPFFGASQEGPLSNMSMLMVLRRDLGHDATVHGFRSTFRDWAADQTSFSEEVVEAALAHTPKTELVAAYRRSDLIVKRRELMRVWADFCCSQAEQATA